MALFRSRTKKGLDFVRIISAVLVLGVLVLVVTESAKYLHEAQVPKSVSSKLEPSVNKLATVLGVAKTSLASLDVLGSVAVDDEDKGSATNEEPGNVGDTAGVTGKKADVAGNDVKIVAKLALLSDSHSDSEYLAKALAKAKKANVDQVAFLGDYTDWGELADLQKVKEVMDASGLNYISLPGDHDLGETRDESNFTKVFGKTYGIFGLAGIKFMYFDNSKNFTTVSDSAITWFNKEIQDTDFLLLSQPLMTETMSRVMGIIDGVKDDAVFTQNKELLEAVRKSNVRVITSGDLHQFSYFEDPVKESLTHYSVGAVLKSQSLEKLNLQSPRLAILTVKEDLSYEVADVPID